MHSDAGDRGAAMTEEERQSFARRLERLEKDREEIEPLLDSGIEPLTAVSPEDLG